MAVRWSEKSLVDLADIYDFYAENGDEAVAIRAIEAIKRDIRRLAITPLLGRKDPRLKPEEQGQYEYWFALRNQYRVYYLRLGPRTIQVYRVWSTRREPLEPNEIKS